MFDYYEKTPDDYGKPNPPPKEQIKVLFLDVDGVLNSFKTIKQYGPDFIDYILVMLLKKIVEQTNAKIVLSSSWRLQERDREIVKRELGYYGMTIFDYTPEIMWRNDEIRTWLNRHPEVENFAILDDDEIAKIDGHFFHTDSDRGLTLKIMDDVIHFLNSDTKESNNDADRC